MTFSARSNRSALTGRTAQAGFSLLEVTVTLAVVGALTKVALPHFMSTSRKAANESEVSPFFSEFHVRQSQFYSENGAFRGTGSSEANEYPTAPSVRGTELTALPASWKQLRIRTPESKARCSYVAVAGVGGSAGSVASTQFAFTPPASAWYYLLARCPGGANDTYYFASNKDSAIRQAIGPASSTVTGTPEPEPTAPSTSTTGSSNGGGNGNGNQNECTGNCGVGQGNGGGNGTANEGNGQGPATTKPPTTTTTTTTPPATTTTTPPATTTTTTAADGNLNGTGTTTTTTGNGTGNGNSNSTSECTGQQGGNCGVGQGQGGGNGTANEGNGNGPATTKPATYEPTVEEKIEECRNHGRHCG